MTFAGSSQLVLSVFPGIGLFDRGFEDAGFSVVRGPDLWWGGDIHKFHTTSGHWRGIIGGPPCQKFSLGNRLRDLESGMVLVREYLRVVDEGQPDWWLMENVPGSPVLDRSQLPAGYVVQLFTIEASHLGSEQRRLRKFHFGHRPGTRELVIARPAPSQPGLSQRTCMASEGKRTNRRGWKKFCELQGLPADFDLPGFKLLEKYRAVGNGVPYPVALALAQAVVARDRGVTPHRVCICGCGEYVTGKEIYAAPRCRKREQRRRDQITPAASQLELA